eukprot:1138913-Pelagomonas_calceolata.AAC.4
MVGEQVLCHSGMARLRPSLPPVFSCPSLLLKNEPVGWNKVAALDAPSALAVAGVGSSGCMTPGMHGGSSIDSIGAAGLGISLLKVPEVRAAMGLRMFSFKVCLKQGRHKSVRVQRQSVLTKWSGRSSSDPSASVGACMGASAGAGAGAWSSSDPSASVGACMGASVGTGAGACSSSDPSASVGACMGASAGTAAGARISSGFSAGAGVCSFTPCAPSAFAGSMGLASAGVCIAK